MTTGPIDRLDNRITEHPVASRQVFDEFLHDDSGVAATLGIWSDHATVPLLIAGILEASPYLTAMLRRHPEAVARFLACVPEVEADRLIDAVARDCSAAQTPATLMAVLRRFKADIALLLGLADLGGVWPVTTVTRVLSRAADAAVAAAVRFLFRALATKGHWLAPSPGEAEQADGYIVIAMGKHGAFELNYSSDIDLVVFYDAALVRIPPGMEHQTILVRLTRDLVRLLQERTEDGYVFRVDLRLRPDPGAMAVAISTDAARVYYESFGQNWERAAMIKARAIAGDLAAGREFLAELAPFIWRRNLDFAAIADIHAMKRQIHAAKGFGTIGVAGHNIKLGRGGIREIEFFVQTQQLIAGGRQPDLRVAETLTALDVLARRDWITLSDAGELADCYRFLRRIEHRLQMLDDEQTQTLPDDPGKLERLARFAGFSGTPAFSTALLEVLERVQRHYRRLFENMPALSRGGANMVFAGEQDDPPTLAALAALGFNRPADVVAVVRGWHHGRYPAVRSARARELLTEVQPTLIEALARTADPDGALASFDRFLSALPSGVQLFSLLRQRPALLDLIAAIMGTAPRLAQSLLRRRRVLDAVLDPGFFGALPERHDLVALINADLQRATNLEDMLDRARVIGAEQSFIIGVRVLTGTIGAARAGPAYAQLAETLIAALHTRIEAEMATQHGTFPGGASAIVAMGKLGGREMTAASDLDLILIYDFDPSSTVSDGARPLAPSQYYTRLTQRLVTAFTAATSEGRLYDVDLRLRPSGQKGPVATQLQSFIGYQANDAWTWEHLALTRARVIAGAPHLVDRIDAAIHTTLTRRRDRARIAADVRDMRSRIEAGKGSTDIWDLKQVRGGLVDLEFIAQHLQLIAAAEHPEVLDTSTAGALRKLAAGGFITPAAADDLLPAADLLGNLTQILRLCFEGTFKPDTAPDGMLALLARVAEVPDRRHLEALLRTTLDTVKSQFDALVT